MGLDLMIYKGGVVHLTVFKQPENVFARNLPAEHAGGNSTRGTSLKNIQG